MHNREIWLAETLVELVDTLNANTLNANFDEAEYSRVLSARLADLLLPAEIGLLVADDIGGLSVAAAGTERMRELLSAESRYAEGPCVTSYRTGQPVLNQCLDMVGERWPRFARAARAAGYRTVTAFPMEGGGEIIGAVSALSARDAGGGSLDESTGGLALALALAEATTICVLQQRARWFDIRTSQQLQRTLDTRVLVEQAKGMVAARLGISPVAASELLRAHARRHQKQLREVAEDTIDGKLSVYDLDADNTRCRARGGPGYPDQSR